jgi:secondary thiamine-phosphate synthase enzyme
MGIAVPTSERVDLIDVTEAVADEVPADLDSGLCHVFVQHTTAGVVVNEAEGRLLSDIEGTLADLVPQNGGYDHDQIDDNADGHLRALLLGESVTVPVEDGDLALGTWQSILLVECDGPQTRQLRVTTVPGR